MGRLAKNGKRCKLYKRAELRDNDHYATTSTIPPPPKPTSQRRFYKKKHPSGPTLFNYIRDMYLFIMHFYITLYSLFTTHKRCVTTYTAGL